MSYEFYNPTRVLFGAGQLNHLHEQKMPGKKAMLVISNGKSTRASGALDRTMKELSLAGVEVVLFDKVGANPVKEIVEEGGHFAKKEGCDFIVALGGGSVMDAAKVMAMYAQQPGDLHSGGILRIDDHVDAQVPLQLRQARGVLLVPDPGDGVAGAHFFGCEAADHVDLIGAGGSDQQIGVLCPSFPKDGGRDTISLDGHHIQRVRGTAQGGLMGVHDGDAVVLTGELVGQAEAHFSIANDDDIQNAAHPGKDLRQKAKEYEAQPYPGPSKEKCALDRTGAGEGAF